MKLFPFLSLLGGTVLLAATVPAHAEGMQWYAGGSLGATSVDNFDAASDVSPDEIIDLLESELGLPVTVDNLRTGSDDSDTGWKIFGGLNFNAYVGVEVFYVNLGEALQSLAVDASALISVGNEPSGSVDAKAEAEVDAFGAAVVGRLPLSEPFSLFGKVGMTAWDADLNISASFSGSASGLPITASDSLSDSDDGTDIMFGAGASWQFSEAWRLRAEWERFAIDDADVDLWSAGIVYVF
ncbi:MAG: outer membrane beta-barrel protein [Pseudomonadota bacterium]